jgi:hypothetical protein
MSGILGPMALTCWSYEKRELSNHDFENLEPISHLEKVKMGQNPVNFPDEISRNLLILRRYKRITTRGI